MARRWTRPGISGGSASRRPTLAMVWLRAAEGRRVVAADHRLRDRRLRLVGAARRPKSARKLGMGLPRPVRVLRRDFRLCHAGGDPARAAGRLGHTASLRHHEPSRLGFEHRLPVPALPLQSGAHAGDFVLLHHVLALSLHGSPSCRRSIREGRRGQRRPSTRTPSSATSSGIRSARSASIALGCSWRCRRRSGAPSASSSADRSGPRLAGMVSWWLNLPIWN